MSNITPDKVDDKRGAILEATMELISERGFHDTPMSQIAKRSGVSAGIIYYYFENKDDLIHELYREVKGKLFETMIAHFKGDGTFEERFVNAWKNTMYYYVAHPKEALFLEQFENSPYDNPDWHVEFADEIGSSMGFFAEGVAQGVLKDLPPELVFMVGFTPGMQLAKYQIRGDFTVSPELVEATARACWDAIKR